MNSKNIYILLLLLIANNPFLSAQFNSCFRNNKNIKAISLNIEKKKDTIQLLSEYQPEPADLNKSYIEKKERKRDFAFPLQDLKVTSNFGNRFHPIDKVNKFHAGIDLRASRDTVYAVFKGIVKDSGYSKTLGYYVKIELENYTAIYAHLSEYYVLKGNKVDAGNIIGLTGNTGKSTGEHLHFSLKHRDKYINPKKLFKLINNHLTYEKF